MSYVQVLEEASAKARERRPEMLGDYRDSNGILHCGICKEPLEHIIFSKKEPPPIGEDLSAEQRQRMIDTISYLKGKRVCCVCKCTKSQREVLEKKKAQDEKEERIFLCFGNSTHLSKTTFAKDNMSKPKVTETLQRYIRKFPEMHEKCISILLSGERDSGKTYYSIALANALIDKGYQVSFSSLYNIVSRTSPYVTYQHIINTQLFADLVIIEDVNADCFEGKNLQVLTAYINTLKSRNIPMLITTRFSGNDLDKIKELCKNISIIKVE